MLIDKQKTIDLLKEIKHIEDVNRVIMMIEKLNVFDVEAISIEWLRENKELLLEHLEVYEDKIEELIWQWENDTEWE